jgi:CBS domain containing-hemolysin-like protein
LGGFIFSQLGRVPLQGDTLEMDGWNFTVEEIHGQRIGKIRAQRKADLQLQEKEKNNGSRPASETH